MNKEKEVRVVPNSELDLQMLITEPVWGKAVPSQLMNDLKKIMYTKNETGEVVAQVSDLWELLGFYTRDMRLSNLSTANGELQYCQHYIDLAGDCLSHNLPKSFIKSLSRAVTILELNQSKGGFLRKRQGTITSENIEQKDNKKGFFGIKRTEG